jgi:predicted membrane-bound mannosyltransferase
MVVPLTVPAAVGLALLGRLGVGSFDRGDIRSISIVVLVLLVVASQIGVTAYRTSFAMPQSRDNELVQYAQSSSDMKPLLSELRRAAQTNDGTDVLFYGNDPSFDGDELNALNETSHDTPRAGQGWFERLPFAWYLEAYGATTNSTDEAEVVGQIVAADNRPPVLITFGASTTCTEEYDNATDIDQYMTGYEQHKVNRFLYDSGCTVSSVVVYVDREP